MEVKIQGIRIMVLLKRDCIKNYFKIRKYLKEILILLLFTPENQDVFIELKDRPKKSK
jgi:hypothetical protein